MQVNRNAARVLPNAAGRSRAAPRVSTRHPHTAAARARGAAGSLRSRGTVTGGRAQLLPRIVVPADTLPWQHPAVHPITATILLYPITHPLRPQHVTRLSGVSVCTLQGRQERGTGGRFTANNENTETGV